MQKRLSLGRRLRVGRKVYPLTPALSPEAGEREKEGETTDQRIELCLSRSSQTTDEGDSDVSNRSVRRELRGDLEDSAPSQLSETPARRGELYAELGQPGRTPIQANKEWDFDPEHP